jgi:16S rRNA (guanine1516-N2)-methyltransferase
MQLSEKSYTLEFRDDRLQVVWENSTISAEFLKGPLGYRLHRGGGKTQAIARAVGLRTYKEKLRVFDVTAGLGRDAFVLASLGVKVQAVERSPLIAMLFLDGLRRARENPKLQSTVDAIELIVGDAKQVLKHIEGVQCPDVVYIDPMFPLRDSSALTKIDMRILREIVGDDQDADALLPLALTKAARRVVVKRPRQAPSLLGISPSFIVEGKANRYDVYLRGDC